MSQIGLFGWVSKEPLVLWHSADSDEDVGNYLPDAPIDRLVMNLWHMSADQMEQYYLYWKSVQPRHRLLHLVNDPLICETVKSRGIPAVFVNQNCFLDERHFTIQPHVPKQFDAVYNARMTPFKRHHLLSDVAAPLLIGGMMAGDDSLEYFAHVRKTLPQGTFTHDPPHLILNPYQIATHMNSARVGVCLSAIEGAMFAAVEYLLCGLPVVSTPSLGGRDAWFDPRFTRIAEPTPQAIASAVRDLADANLDPQEIRAATIARISEHRHRFTSAVQEIFERERVGLDYSRVFYSKFQSKFGRWRPYEKVMDYLDEDCDK